MAERFDVSRDGITLAGERWPGGARTVLLLHEGVADRRGWAQVAGLLAPELTVVAYDRRGYGQTPPGTEPFSHLDDLLAVIAHASAGPVWLAGASAGGGLAPGAALAAPGRVAGLVVMGTAVSGAPEPELDAATRRLEPLLPAQPGVGLTGAEQRELRVQRHLQPGQVHLRGCGGRAQFGCGGDRQALRQARRQDHPQPRAGQSRCLPGLAHGLVDLGQRGAGRV
jgi:pimeloyl-ACP methyl ester carboxylesterase